MKKYLSTKETEAKEYSIVTTEDHFTIVSNDSEDERLIEIPYRNLYEWPQLSEVMFIEAEILNCINEYFPDSRDKAVLLCYGRDYEKKINSIAIINKLEFS